MPTAPPTAAAAPTSAEPFAMLEPLTMRCIVSGSTFTNASRTIVQPTRMHSESAVTSLNVFAQLGNQPGADADQKLQDKQLGAH